MVFCRGTGHHRNREGEHVAYTRSPRLNRIDQVVPGELAIIGDPRENRGTIYGDHFSMVKFSTRDDPGYKKVVNSIEMLLEELGEGSLTPSKGV